jgi:hypothetical protein
MRQAYEPLLVRHQVDVVLSGHVHAYERTKPVVNYQVGSKGRYERGPAGLTLQQQQLYVRCRLRRCSV